MKTKALGIGSVLAAALTAAALLQQSRLPVSAVAKDAEINTENIMALLEEYDPDGAYIMRFGTEQGDDILKWFPEGETILHNLATAVHEQTHYFILQGGSGSREDIYTGGEQSVTVPYTTVYRTEEMTADVPEELRTFRFDTYVGKPTDNLASNIDGVYGLLNEFTAYCWGLNNTVVLYDYYKAEANEPEDWVNYVNLIDNGKMAYSEFHYYILEYLAYAQNVYPNVYDGIMANPEFLSAYQTIEGKYRSLTETSEQYLNEIAQSTGGSREFGTVHIGDTAMPVSDADFSKLIDKTAEPEMQEIERALGVAAYTPPRISAAPAAGGAQITTAAAGLFSTATETTATAVPAQSGGSSSDSTAFWKMPSNYVLVGFWTAFLIALLVIITELIRGRRKNKKQHQPGDAR